MTQLAALPSTITVLERGWVSSNNIVFDDGDCASVVDTGYAIHAQQTVQLVRAALAGKPLTRIVNTHLHSDHVGGNAALRAQFDAGITIPPGQADAVERWDEEALGYAPTGQVCPRFRFDALLAPDSFIELGGLTWQAVSTPGHDAHMIVLYNDDERILISADALWENGFGAIFPEAEGASGFAEQRGVLEWIDRIQPRIVIPGHGRPFVEVPAALDRAMRRLEALEASPERNARHIGKVLVKFWLLQVRSTTWAELISHLAGTRYLNEIHQRYFADQTAVAVIERAVAELVAGGAAARDGNRIENRDG
jgi:glyoxylase-like metal-dependent hydrolase (beta-lactamase superfamily II)